MNKTDPIRALRSLLLHGANNGCITDGVSSIGGDILGALVTGTHEGVSFGYGLETM